MSNFGVPGVRTAGKTGTAELGPGRSRTRWFIGFAPAQGSATPAIAVAVIVEGGGSGSGRAAPIGGAVMAEWLKILARAAEGTASAPTASGRLNTIGA